MAPRYEQEALRNDDETHNGSGNLAGNEPTIVSEEDDTLNGLETFLTPLLSGIVNDFVDLVSSVSHYPNGYVQFAEECLHLSQSEGIYVCRVMYGIESEEDLERIRVARQKIANKDSDDFPFASADRRLSELDVVEIIDVDGGGYGIRIKLLGGNTVERFNVVTEYMTDVFQISRKACQMSFKYSKTSIDHSNARYVFMDCMINPAYPFMAADYTKASSLIESDRHAEFFEPAQTTEARDDLL